MRATQITSQNCGEMASHNWVKKRKDTCGGLHFIVMLFFLLQEKGIKLHSESQDIKSEVSKNREK